MAFVYKNPLHEPADHSFDMDEKGRVASPHTSDFLAVASRDVESLDIDEVESEHAVHHARLRTCCKWIRWVLLASLAASAAIGLALYLGPILLEKVCASELKSRTLTLTLTHDSWHPGRKGIRKL